MAATEEISSNKSYQEKTLACRDTVPVLSLLISALTAPLPNELAINLLT